MTPFEIRDMLKTFRVIVDTREQQTEQALMRYAQFDCDYERRGLSYGDYAYNLTFPDGSDLFGESKGLICPPCVVERKMSLDELAICFTSSRERFEKEFKRAAEHSAKVYLIVEDGSWHKIFNGKYRSKLNPKAYAASLTAWIARYDISLHFVKSEVSGRLIKELLYREAKERLENGNVERLDKD